MGIEFQLYNGDCLDLMRHIPSESIDMILCDLPYGTTKHPDDIRLPFDLLWESYERIIKENGAIVLFAQGMFYVDLVNSNRKLFRYDLVWDKELVTGFLNANRMPLRRHEQIAVFYKKLPVYHPQFTKGQPLHGRGTAYLKEDQIQTQNYNKYNVIEDVRKGSTQKYPTSILQIPKPHPSVATHRTEKPVELCKWLIATYTNEGDYVLDNCMGSGSTGKACLELGRKFIGIEKDPQIFQHANEALWRQWLCQQSALEPQNPLSQIAT